MKLVRHKDVRFFNQVRVAKLLEFWPPVVACVLALGAGLADLLWDQFRVFALGHAMITALFSMTIFAVLTTWFANWLALRRERSKRAAVTGNAVRVTAEMGWMLSLTWGCRGRISGMRKFERRFRSACEHINLRWQS